MVQNRLPLFKIPSEKRSNNMRAIRSSGNKTTEKRLVYLLAKSGCKGWRLHPKYIRGSPDFVFERESLIIFTDGCFFHGCPHCGHIPKTNTAYWRAKIARNRRRDAAVSRRLKLLGYSIVRIWECQLRESPRLCLGRIRRALFAKSYSHLLNK